MWASLCYRYCRAPECFNESLGGISTKCDIFSFGVILWELVAQKRPWDGLSEFQVRGGIKVGHSYLCLIPVYCTYFDLQMIFKVSVHNARLDIPKGPDQCPQAVASLITSCWENMPERRPSAEEVLRQIEIIVGDQYLFS